MKSVLLTVLFISWEYAFAVTSRSNLPPNAQRYLIVPDISGQLLVDDLIRKPLKAEVTIADMKLYFYTKANQEPGYYIDPANFEQLADNPDYDPCKLNVFVVHGLNNNNSSLVNTLIKTGLLEHFDINVFVVDWSKPANTFYTNARKAVPKIANFLAEFVKKMYAQYQLSGSDFRFIGHSLGAHVCGDAGSALNGEIKYIVGLDPAGPLFYEKYPKERLDPTDAEYVQVIHTNAAMLGYPDSMGHADFYPNGGTRQRGCNFDPFGICAHSRAYEYYAESLNNSAFLAARCTNYHSFTTKECDNNDISYMGQFVIDTSARGDYYLDTSKDEPYGLGRIH